MVMTSPYLQHCYAASGGTLEQVCRPALYASLAQFLAVSTSHNLLSYANWRKLQPGNITLHEYSAPESRGKTQDVNN